MDSLNRLLGDPNERQVKKLWPLARQVRAKSESPEIRMLGLEDLPKETAKLKARVQAGESLDDVLVETFALVIRACELIKGKSANLGAQTFEWNMVPFDVQILGGIVLHRGGIAEMKTGEGKTLVCTMPVILNALSGKGVHVVTVNDYLAKRDALWMSMLYEALGLTVGVIVHEKDHEERKAAYNCDITYGTNNEFGFDYLRDNMAVSTERQVQRGLNYAIVDEVDSILIDEARTPLIISQPAEESTVKYQQYALLVKNLQPTEHFTIDEKQRAAVLTEAGVQKMEELLGVENIYTEKGFEEVHHIEQALRGHAVYKRDVDYVVKDNEVIIVDEFTGRLMPGRRYSHGLHQALEAKENVEVQRESRTLATITFQNYFRLFPKLAGMTGTAMTEAEEFESIYKLRTISIPTHRPVQRNDKSDAVYRTMLAKFTAVAVIAAEKFEKGQPVLIGTTSIEKSEAMSTLLTQRGVPHQVLNAKQHEKEAEIVANAGQRGAITIATNMAGRGTDIKLGEGIAELGGLCVLGTERHEARRIDNQLRGRSGRQGDPGESRFFVSMEDELMRLFGGDRLKGMMERLNVPDDVPLENSLVTRSIESAQKRVEGRNFDIRRHVVQYDDVLNKHRDIIYKRRQKILQRIAGGGEQAEDSAPPLHQDVLAALEREVTAMVRGTAAHIDSEKWDATGLLTQLGGLHPDLVAGLSENEIRSFDGADNAVGHLAERARQFYEEKCAKYDAKTVARAELLVTLRTMDTLWMDHIDAMSHLREQVAFSGYAQRDPLVEYQDRGYRTFAALIAAIDAGTVRTLLQIDFGQFVARIAQEIAQEEAAEANLQTNEAEIEGALGQTGVDLRDAVAEPAFLAKRPSAPPQRTSPRPAAPMEKVGRNDPCPCGSGKKYKKCHGANL